MRFWMVRMKCQLDFILENKMVTYRLCKADSEVSLPFMTTGGNAKIAKAY